MNYWLIFLTGLTTGGFTCAAMQGGLLASVIASGKRQELNSSPNSRAAKSFDFLDWGPVLAFLIAKLLAHVVLGAGLGLMGSVLELSLTTKLIFQILAAIFMLGTAGNLLELHPIFRWFAIRPPRFAHKLLKNTTQNQALFAPALLGLLTVFIPCGVTQAMEIIAINSGSPMTGALTMGVFVLGTAPMFALIGVATAKFSEYWKRNFLRFAALALVYMALSSVNGVLTVSNSPLAINRLGPILVKALPPYTKSDKVYKGDPNVTLENGIQKVTIKIENRGYTPRRFAVKAGLPVELTLSTEGGVYSCATAFTFKAFDIYDVLKPVDTKVHKFTPTKKGTYTFACSMGMYSGVMEVI